MLACPNASFTDLAEIVSRIEPVKPAAVDGKFVTRMHVARPRILIKLRLFVCHLSVVVHLRLSGWLLSCSPHVSRCPAPPPSDESDYHTDYEEEAVESALSDLELSNHAGRDGDC